jgi:hypothetical protein
MPIPRKVRSTDAQMARPMPTVIRDPESARKAALESVTTFCGWCSFSTTSTDPRVFRDHQCADASGRDLTETKRLHAEGARHASEALKNYPVPACAFCGRISGPGDSHDCPGTFTKEPLPHDAAVARWQRQGVASAIENMKEPTPNEQAQAD